MSTLGVANGAAVNAGWAMPGAGFGFGSSYTMPSPGGYITEIHAYFDTFSGSGAVGHLCIWDDATGALLLDVTQGTINNGTESAGGQQWWSQSVANYWVPGGKVIWIGGWCNQNTLFSSITGGSSQQKSMGTSAPGSFSGHTSTSIGTVGSGVTYTPLAAPTLTNDNPSVGTVGTTVVLTGTNLLQTSGITCCGVTVSSYTINSDTQITMTVPSGAVGAGTIVVTTPAGTASIAFTGGNGHVDRAGTFATGSVSVMRSGSFSQGVFKVMRSGSWVTGS